MKPKQILILGVILGVLALGILLKAWVRSAGEGSVSDTRAVSVLPDFDPVKVERILIARGSQVAPVELANENGAWKVKSLWNAPANSVKVENLIRQLPSIHGELRATGKELLKDFGIEDADSFSIRLLGNGDKPLADLRVGTKKSGAAGSFVRKAGGSDVYGVDMDLADALGIYTGFETAKPKGDVWADLSLFRLDPEKVTRIELYLSKGDENTRVLGLAREVDPKDPGKSSWKYLREEMRLPVDPDKIMRFIATMNSVRAEKVVDPSGRGYGLEKPVWRLGVTEDGKEKVLGAGPKNTAENRCYVRGLAGASVFSLAGAYFEDLNKDDTNFVKDAVPPGFAKVPPLQKDKTLPSGAGQNP